jgi:hypothetical protein
VGSSSIHAGGSLGFASLEPGRAIECTAPPTLALSAPRAGWIDWHFAAGSEQFTVHLSYLFACLVDIWIWAMAVAHRLMPVSLRLDEEGKDSVLCAEWGDDGHGQLRLTLWQGDTDGRECGRFVWREDRVGWLRRVGSRFGAYLGEGFDVVEWRNHDAWPELAQYLPWCLPEAIAPHTRCSWPLSPRRAWFFLAVSQWLDPVVLHRARCSPDRAALARLEFLCAWRRQEALVAAWRLLSGEPPAEDIGRLDRALDDARDLFEDCETEREVRQAVDAPGRVDDLSQAMGNGRRSLHFLRTKAFDQLVAEFPLVPGQIFIDECLRPGRLLLAEGRRMVIDWGEVGISTEYGFHWGSRTTWRWPIDPPADLAWPDTPLLRRWRVFAKASGTAALFICPCCGYPHLDAEPEEIMDCLLCGWPLYLILNHRLPDPDEPLCDDSRGDAESWPPLAASREYFAEHGDAFPLADTRRTRWLRQPDVVAQRRAVIADFASWLADPPRWAEPLSSANWGRLDAMSRADEEV